MSRYTPSSNLRLLSQGVAAAIQNRHLSLDPVSPAGPTLACAGRGMATVGVPATLRAAVAPNASKKVLRVVSIVSSPWLWFEAV
jgi:hypothetical protein